MRLVHIQSVIKHAIKMNFTSTAVTLESFWNPLSMSYAHKVGALVILYLFVKVNNPGNCSLYSTWCLVHSQSIIKHAIKMVYTSALETLESFSNHLSMSSAHQVGGLAILYPLVKVSSVGNCSW